MAHAGFQIRETCPCLCGQGITSVAKIMKMQARRAKRSDGLRPT
jgi:hypothetical protein